MGRAAETDRLRLNEARPPPDRSGGSWPFPLARELSGIRFTLLEPLAPSRARFTFAGVFESEEVTWDATLRALPGRLSPADPRPDYIEVGEAGDRGRRLEVALSVAEIDEATILRTILMIRQYRRLRRGRHGFGDATSC